MRPNLCKLEIPNKCLEIEFTANKERRRGRERGNEVTLVERRTSL